MSLIRLQCEELPDDMMCSLEGSKSYTNRALTIAAIQNKPIQIHHISPSEDTEIFCRALRQLGYGIERTEDTCLLSPCDSPPTERIALDIGPAGTCMRFLTALTASTPRLSVDLSGTERMHKRPIGALVTALEDAGASISYTGTHGCPPLSLEGRQLKGGLIEIPGDVSSQFISALLMIAPRMLEGLSLSITGEFLSESYVAMTIDSMRRAGVFVEKNGTSYTVAPGAFYETTDLFIEGDASGASYLWSMAALSGKRVLVNNIGTESIQGDAQFPTLLERMGCHISTGSDAGVDWIAVQGSDTLKAIDADMTQMPDTAQTLAVIAACAEGVSTLSGLSTLRIKETDRIDAVAQELAACGIQVEAGPDFMKIHGGKPRSARIKTYDDHRMAMAFAPLVCRVSSLEIEDPDVVGKSFPGFWEVLETMGVQQCISSS